MLLEGILVPQWICCWNWSWLQRPVWVCCYKPYFHSWPTQRHKMKVLQPVCGHSLGEITHEQAGRTRAFTQISHWASESISNSSLDSLDHLHIFTYFLPLWRTFQPQSQTPTHPDIFYMTWQPLVWKSCQFTVFHWCADKPTCIVKELFLFLVLKCEHQSLSTLLARHNHCRFMSWLSSHVSTIMT